MGISLKSRDEIELIRRAGRLVYETLERCRSVCEPGVTTDRINEEAERALAESGAMGLFKNYPTYRPGEGFPAATCISVNEEVVHGIPGERVIQDGDIVSIDFGCRIDGWCGDSATTIRVGTLRPKVRRLCDVTDHVLRIALENVRAGRRWSEIAGLMEGYAERAGMGVVKDFVGHGIGRSMHEEPKLPNFVSRALKRNDVVLEPGMVVAIEPMCTLGTDEVTTRPDQWTVATADGSCAAHYEHMVVVTENGCQLLTDGS